MIKVTEKKREAFAQLEIFTVEDLLKHYPLRYEIIDEKPFELWKKGEKLVFGGILISPAKVLRFGRNRSMTRFTVLYDEEEIECTIFNRPWSNMFVMDKPITLFGVYQGNHKFTCSQFNTTPIEQQKGIHPVYAGNEAITQKEWKKYIDRAIQVGLSQMKDLVPIKYREKYKLSSHRKAIHDVHQPADMETVKQAVRTLKYEEFLMFSLSMTMLKRFNQQDGKNAKIFDEEQVWQLKNSLSFDLTHDQEKAIEDIIKDLKSDHIMMRLIQGDVGSGKTMVAGFAAYACCCSHKQVALLAPTQILAKQHYKNLVDLFKDTELSISCYLGNLKGKEKVKILDDLKANRIDILIGTHALFQEDVQFYDLGLVIADEQHRFGVAQRRKLLSKGEKVDFLLMSATPIPRTLATSLFGDLDVSTIMTLPKGRVAVTTQFIKSRSMKPILQEVLRLIDEGNQCYVVCPSIESNPEYRLQGVEDIYKGMDKILGQRYHIGLLHGRMNSEEKEKVMEDFLNKKIDILVCTTVIEVGVDVKDANIMVIYDAHRFGMSQIHQLRGRVGRGQKAGYCYLLSDTNDEASTKRLETLQQCGDGFEIAYQDLLLRGPGDMLGTRQSGIPGFILGDCIQDHQILDITRKDAQEIVEHLDEEIDLKNDLNEQVGLLQYLD